ncbi:MAG: uracil-DNA glycosylase family protein, partial [Bacteroidales bacterium]|nr:uracil-DNA glycosylase family protein [Bacteroidales bacterium]
NDASDANLEILEQVNLEEILSQIPDCKAIVSTGGKSADVVADILGVKKPEIGDFVEKEFCNRVIKFYRMPSSSRAYPMKVGKKAEIYSALKNILNL